MTDRPGMKASIFDECRLDPWFWLTHCVKTLDPHDEKSPIKPFPYKEYLRALTRFWELEPLALISKSRQMMITWLIVALYTHSAQFQPGRLIFFQSKKFLDACDLVGRAKIIHENQPPYIKRPAGEVKVSSSEMRFIETGSIIRAIPQGGDQIRMHTPSGLFMDEAAFMPEAAESYTAAKPAIDGGGRLTMVSSANPGFFADMVRAPERDCPDRAARLARKIQRRVWNGRGEEEIRAIG